MPLQRVERSKTGEQRVEHVIGTEAIIGRHPEREVSAEELDKREREDPRTRERCPMSTDQPEWGKKAEVFKHSYTEVLLALKHQDEKLNRTLTALAFLTAAAVTLFVNYAVKHPAVRFPDEPPIPVTTFFFVTFLGSALFALLFALAAIGPSDALPRVRRKERSPSDYPSLLFYARIGHDNQWGTYVAKDAAWLEERLARSFHTEAEILSQRIDYKIARSREAGACLQLAMLALILLGVFAARPLSAKAQWWIAAAVMTGVLVQPFWDALLMWHFQFKDENPLTDRAMSYVWVGIAVLASAAAVFSAPWTLGHWWAISAALGTIVATRFSLAQGRPIARVVLPATAVGAVAAAVLAWAV